MQLDYFVYLGKLTVIENTTKKMRYTYKLSWSLKGCVTAMNLSIAMMTNQTMDMVMEMLLIGWVR